MSNTNTWIIDPAHSSVTFSVKHLMISKVRGSFGEFTGQAEVGEDLSGKRLVGTVNVTTIDTKDANRDAHLRSADFFDVENYPVMTLEAENWAIPSDNKEFTLEGNLTIKGVTHPVTFKGEFGGVVVDGYGKTKAAAELTATINRTDWGLSWNSALETGGVLVGEDVTIHIDAQAVLAEPEEEEEFEPFIPLES